MPEVITVGETMAAMVPYEYGALRYVYNFRLKAGGAESNVAVGLSKLHHTSGWISRLGDDELGYMVRNALRAEGVDMTQVIWDNEHPTGMMVKQTKHNSETKVIYYRKGSAASYLNVDDINIDYLKTARIIHMSGILPVLSDSCMEVADFIFDFADKNGIMISFDPNVRKKVWGTRDFAPVLREMCLKSDIVMLGKEEAESLFGTSDVEETKRICFEEGKAKYFAFKSGSKGAWVSDGGKIVNIPPYPCTVVDPVGAGDGFDAGFISGILENKPIEICGKMGGIVGAMATETRGDMEGYPRRSELDDILYQHEIVYR